MLLHRFPVEYQMDSQDCGPASLKIIAKHFGKFYSCSSCVTVAALPKKVYRYLI